MPSDVDVLSFAQNLRLYSSIKAMVRAAILITVHDRPLGTWIVRPLIRRSTSQFEALTPDETTNPPSNASSKKDIADKIEKEKAFPGRGNGLWAWHEKELLALRRRSPSVSQCPGHPHSLLQRRDPSQECADARPAPSVCSPSPVRTDSYSRLG